MTLVDSLNFEIVGAFVGGEGVEELADGSVDGIDGSGGSLSEQMVELGKDLFDQVQSGEYFGRKNSLAPAERMS
jgi:hypothetical protein